SLADSPHYVKVKVDIVMGGKDGSGEFSRCEEMTKISARIAAANGTSALRIDGPLILSVARVLDQDAAFASVEAGVARGARGQHAIHHVDTERNIIGDLLGTAHAHQVARTISGQQRRDFGGHLASDFVRFANGQAANGVARKIEFKKLASALAPQISKRRALHDAELPLAEIAVTASAFLKIDAGAAGPLGSALQRGFGFFAGRGRFDALIEDHGDVRAQRELNLSGLFRGGEVLGAVKLGTEAHGFIANLSQFGKAEDLIAAGIRKNRARPGHESVQAA